MAPLSELLHFLVMLRRRFDDIDEIAGEGGVPKTASAYAQPAFSNLQSKSVNYFLFYMVSLFICVSYQQ